MDHEHDYEAHNGHAHDEAHAHIGAEHAHEHPHDGGQAHEHSHDHEHVHSHEHEHTHADGTTHTHPHDHTHTHEHGHGDSNCPGPAHCNADCASCGDPRAELMALMRYMVNHNTAHANELAQLAGRLKDLGDATAYEQVMQAVSDFEKGNMRLSTVLAAMNIPQQ